MLAVRSRGRVADRRGQAPFPTTIVMLVPVSIHSSLITLHSSLFTHHSSLFTLHSSLFTHHSSLFTLYSSLLHSSHLHSSLLHHLARLHDKADMFHQRYVGQWVAGDSDQVGGAPGLNRS